MYYRLASYNKGHCAPYCAPSAFTPAAHPSSLPVAVLRGHCTRPCRTATAWECCRLRYSASVEVGDSSAPAALES